MSIKLQNYMRNFKENDYGFNSEKILWIVSQIFFCLIKADFKNRSFLYFVLCDITYKNLENPVMKF